MPLRPDQVIGIFNTNSGIGGWDQDDFEAEVNAIVPPDSAMVRVTEDDTTSGFLEEKVVAGDNITLTVLNPGGNEQLEINAEFTDESKVLINGTDATPGYLATKLQFSAEFSNTISGAADKTLDVGLSLLAYRATVSVADTTPGFLASKLQPGNGISLDIQNPGANENLLITASNIFFRGTLIAPTGAPDANEDMTFTETFNEEGFVLQATDTQLLFPSTGFYAVMLWSLGDASNAFNAADVNAATVPNLRALCTVNGIGTISLQQAPANYIVTPTSTALTFAAPILSQVGVVEITDETTQYLRAQYRNQLLDATNYTQAFFIVVVKLK